MNKLYHSKSNIYSHIHVFIGLCMAICIIFISNNYNVFAQGHSYTTWGSYNGNTPVQEISGNFDISLNSMIEQSIYNSVFNSDELTNLGITSQHLFNSLNYYNISSIISNWQPGNPEYYLNISYYDSYQYDSRGFIFYFSKDSGLSSYSLSVENNNFISVNNTGSLFFSKDLHSFIPDYSILSTSNAWDSIYAKSICGYNTFHNISSQWDYFTCNNTQLIYRRQDNVDSNILLSRFSEFLNSYDIYVFCVIVPDTSFNNSDSNNLCYFSNGTFLSSGAYLYPLFSTIQSYDYLSSDITYDYTAHNGYVYQIPYLNRFSTGIILQDTSDILSYGYKYGGNSGGPTPSPIPTFLWNTPTPFPNVTFIPATLTPIVVPYDPNIITGTDTFDNLSGYLGILHYYITQPINKFMSTVITCIYSFSDWFKFILVVPIICLFAFIIGRLKRK